MRALIAQLYQRQGFRARLKYGNLAIAGSFTVLSAAHLRRMAQQLDFDHSKKQLTALYFYVSGKSSAL